MPAIRPYEPVEPIVSVVIAARNEASVFSTCLQALARQDFRHPYEVVVVDNASTDFTSKIAESHFCKVIHEPIEGQVIAKRRGVDASRAAIVAVLDADCVANSGWLSALYAGLTENNDQVAAVSCYYRFDSDIPMWGQAYNGLVRCLVITLHYFSGSMPFVLGGNVAFRKASYDRAGGYSVACGIAETEIGIARKLKVNGVIRYVPGMAVRSSSRRFRSGLWSFLYQYKIRLYLWPYFKCALKGG